MIVATPTSSVTLDRLEVQAYTIPTEQPESDGTYEWDSTTIVVVQACGGDRCGIGYTYADAATAHLISDRLAPMARDRDVMNIASAWIEMRRSLRNLGLHGIAAMAMSAVDCALWDLKARLLDVPLVSLFGTARNQVPAYASGGFTSYDDDRLARQLSGWVKDGFAMVKMKVGRDANADRTRVAVARRTIGDDVKLFVDANGAYGRKQALSMAWMFATEYGVSWFEEPRPSEDLTGLRLLRDQGPPGMEIVAGEYGYDLPYFQDMIDEDAVDVLMADVTRCGGMTGFLKVAALCEANHVPLSAHCAPQLSLHVCAAAAPVRHLEFFHDHARIEGMLFDGAIAPVNGTLSPDLTTIGNGLTLKRADARRFEL